MESYLAWVGQSAGGRHDGEILGFERVVGWGAGTGHSGSGTMLALGAFLSPFRCGCVL